MNNKKNDMQIPLNIGPSDNQFDPDHLFENQFDPYLLPIQSNSGLLARINDIIMSEDNDNDQSVGKKKFHKHTSQQTQELEKFYNQCSHPNSHQRIELGRRLGLDGDQVKFWFQNRRAKSKNKIKLTENISLKRESERLRDENKILKHALESLICENCRAVSYEQFQLEFENAKLKAELSRITALTRNMLGESTASLGVPVPLPTIGSGSELTINKNSFDGLSPLDSTMHDMVLDHAEGDSTIHPSLSMRIPGLEM